MFSLTTRKVWQRAGMYLMEIFIKKTKHFFNVHVLLFSKPPPIVLLLDFQVSHISKSLHFKHQETWHRCIVYFYVCGCNVGLSRFQFWPSGHCHCSRMWHLKPQTRGVCSLTKTSSTQPGITHSDCELMHSMTKWQTRLGGHNSSPTGPTRLHLSLSPFAVLTWLVQ